MSDNCLKFLRYQKIYEHADAYQGCHSGKSWEMSAQINSADRDGWIVQEKVHGSNFSVYASESSCGVTTVRYAKRNGFLNLESDCFYDFQQLDDGFRGKVMQLWSLIKTMHASAIQISVYGELCGGYLPSEQDMDKAKGSWKALFEGRVKNGAGDHRRSGAASFLKSGPVQEGVYYSESLSFIVFDIAVLLQEDYLVFLGHEQVKELCRQVGLLVSEALLSTQKYAEAANFNVSKLVSSLALTLASHGRTSGPVPKPVQDFLENDNLAEGIIIRPAGSITFSVRPGASPNTVDVPPRLLLKRKNPRFAEEIENCDAGQAATPAAHFRMRILTLVNQNRLSAVLSKDLGNSPNDVSRQQAWKAEAIEQLRADVWESFWEKGWDLGQVDFDAADGFIGEACERTVQERLGKVLMYRENSSLTDFNMTQVVTC